MSNHQPTWILGVCLLAAALLFVSGSVAAAGSAQPFSSGVTAPVPADLPKSPMATADVGMSDLLTQTFEFTGTFPAGWQTYDNITPSPGSVYPLTYSWSTTDYTQAQGTRSAVAVGPNAGSAFLPGTVYTDPVDSWMVFPVDLSSVWQAQMDFAYLKPSASGYLTVAISTDYDPISRTGTFTGEAPPQATTWTTHTLPLSSYAGRKVYVAFRYQSPNGGQQSDGPFVDDLHVRANYRVMLPIVRKWMLTIGKSVSAGTAMPGQSLVYSITVNNTDGYNAATGVSINDTLPVSTTFVSADGASFSNGVVTWSGLSVPAAGSVVRHVTVAIPSSVSWEVKIVNKDYSVSAPPDTTVVYGPPVTTTLAGTFVDDFTNPATGWPVGDYDPNSISCWPPPGSWRAHYLPGRGYGVMTVCDRAAQLYPAPVRLADTRNFTLEADMRSNQADLWYSSYGLFFNGTDDLHEVYTVEFYQGQDPPEWDIRYWENFNWSDKILPPADIRYWGRCWTCNGADYAWNHILVKREGSAIEVWMGSGMGRSNLSRMAAISDDKATTSQHNRVGFLHANFEWRGDAGPYLYDYIFGNFQLSSATK